MKLLKVILYCLFVSLILPDANAQCTWQLQLSDGFEYSTPCTDVLPGVVYTNIPQSYSVHSGSKSLYLNFIDCAGGTGTCAGDTVYIRSIPVCPYIDYRISAFYTTTFSGSQSDLNLIVVDANDSVLANTASVLAPYSPAWINYQSGSFTPTTATIKFIMITNSDGQNGNDLSMDDFLMENCFNFNIGADTTVCVNQTVTLNAGSGYDTYLWSNGDTTQTTVASTTGGAASTTLFIVHVSDTNGCHFTDSIRVTFLPCTGVSQISQKNQIHVFTNLQTNELTIELANHKQAEEMSITDAAGREILRKTITNTRNVLSLDKLPGGFYFYSVRSGKEILQRGKFLVE